MLNSVCARYLLKTCKALSLRNHDYERWNATALFVRALLSDCNKTIAYSKNGYRRDWNKAVSEAENIVGHSTSFLSLRWLVSDEIANITLHLRKLRGSKHPILKTAKYFVNNGKSSMYKWGLIVLLISNATGYSSLIPNSEQDKNAGVLYSQRTLAEITEMVRISHIIHTSLTNLQPSIRAGHLDTSFVSNMIFGNKIALLSGDYILAHCLQELSNLRNQELTELIMSAVRDLNESEFIGYRDEQNNPLPSKPQPNKIPLYEIDEDYIETDLIIPMDVESCMGIPEKEWALRHILSAGSLLGKSCQGSLKLALKPEEVQQKGYLFGKHLSLAWQACLDLEPFRDGILPVDGKFSLVSAPVLYHLEYDPNIYVEIEKGKTSIENIDFRKLYNEILMGPGLEKTRMLQEKHTKAAMRVLENFPPSDGRTALNNILLVMQNF